MHIHVGNDMIWVPNSQHRSSEAPPGSIDVPPTWSMLSIGFIDDGLRLKTNIRCFIKCINQILKVSCFSYVLRINIYIYICIYIYPSEIVSDGSKFEDLQF